jgi:hypothetical protein
VGSGAAVVGFGAAVVGLGAAVVGPGAALVGLAAGLEAALEAVASGAFVFGFRDGFAPLSSGVPGFEALAVAAGVSDGTGVGSPCCRLLHRLYQSGPSRLSSAPAAEPRSCRCPSSGQSVQAMATEGMPMTPMATAATTVRRYCF